MNEEQPGGMPSGLNANEAREFHALFITSFLLFTGIATFAHFLAWLWRPWLPGEDGYSMINGTTEQLSHLITYLT